jgi:hypothetical protein
MQYRYKKKVKEELLHQKLPQLLFKLESQMNEPPSKEQIVSYNLIWGMPTSDPTRS